MCTLVHCKGIDEAILRSSKACCVNVSKRQTLPRYSSHEKILHKAADFRNTTDYKTCAYHTSHTKSPELETTPRSSPSRGSRIPHSYLVLLPCARDGLILAYFVYTRVCDLETRNQKEEITRLRRKRAHRACTQSGDVDKRNQEVESEGQVSAHRACNQYGGTPCAHSSYRF